MADSWATRNNGGSLSAPEAGELARQIASLSGSSFPLSAGLAAASEELPRGRLRRSMSELASALEAGMPLDQAIANQEKRIPSHIRKLVGTAIQSGRLGDVLTRFSGYTGLGVDLKRRLSLAMAYPVLLMTVALGLFLFVTGFVAAQFEQIFKDFAIPLPALTIFVLMMSHLVSKLALPVGIALVALLASFIFLRACLPSAMRRSLATHIPLFGPIWASVRLSEFCRLLALLMESQLPLPEAIRLAGEGIEDSGLNRACALLARDVEAGRPFAASMSKLVRFPRGLSRLLGWAEDKMALPELLHLAAALFETEARSRATVAGTIVSILSVTIVLALIMVIPALFLPLITLISRLSG
jgi:type II secretory pathway component PulF